MRVAPLLFSLVLPLAAGFLAAPRERSSQVIMGGIPKMFRWLTDQYPTIMERINEGTAEGIDNLYLDMNGIIHQCTHGNSDVETTATLKEQFVRIFQFTDKVCKVVRPRKLVYLAVDGIAPRAKMNQQRSRRFRSSQEREEAQKEREVTAQLRRKHGADVYADRRLPDDVLSEKDYGGAGPPPRESSGQPPFDSNCITPGTEFMHKLTIAFQAWLDYKVKEDPFYSDLLIIFTGSDLPGEGEHKVMDYIRSQDFDPELRHCFYGLDADLIMLSLVTHQKNFRLLREKASVRLGKRAKDPLSLTKYDFEILEVALLREMIELQFDGLFVSHPDRKERFVDDFVFACMLVGNDFLPQMPHLDILDGALDLSFMTYRALAPFMEGFLTDKERIHLPRFELLARALASFEAKYFERRGTLEKCPEFQDASSYRDHYYATKFHFDPEQPDYEQKIRDVAYHYTLGLFWCAQYYHRGADAWDWYYPYLYAPLASDLKDLASFHVEFPSSQSKPFTPLMQLLSVLPPQSKSLLPRPYAEAMDHPLLRHAYPTTFDVDPNGKHQAWEAVVLIPFLDEDVMTGVLSQIDHAVLLTKQERLRNDVDHAEPWLSRQPRPDDLRADAPTTPEQQQQKQDNNEGGSSWSSSASKKRGGANPPQSNNNNKGNKKPAAANKKRTSPPGVSAAPANVEKPPRQRRQRRPQVAPSSSSSSRPEPKSREGTQ